MLDYYMCNNSINRIERDRRKKLVFDERRKEKIGVVWRMPGAQVADHDELKTHQFSKPTF